MTLSDYCLPVSPPICIIYLNTIIWPKKISPPTVLYVISCPRCVTRRVMQYSSWTKRPTDRGRRLRIGSLILPPKMKSECRSEEFLLFCQIISSRTWIGQNYTDLWPYLASGLSGLPITFLLLLVVHLLIRFRK